MLFGCFYSSMFIGGVVNKNYKMFSFLDSSLIAKDYLALFYMLLIAIVLTLIILSLSYFLSRQNPDSEKLSAYECGFEPYEDSRHIFDIRFYIVAIYLLFLTLKFYFYYHGVFTFQN